ncbi:MAG: hypothetical protein HBSAPP04_18000 [Ignavibacteriaceae bacterium]|nr:MAG: hypothetical protein HBSAPP04_18000 [Ignavibacteriaceae bacterium]
MSRYVSLIALLLLTGSTSFSQVYTIANGGWHHATTWSNNQVPDSNTNVVIRHTVDIYTNWGCRNITIDSSGVLKNGLLEVYGTMRNYGRFDAYSNSSSYDGLILRDSLFNYSKLETEILWLTGNRDHYIWSKDTIKIADMNTPDSNRTIHLAGNVIFKGGYILLRNSNISFHDTLTLVGTIVDGGIIDGHGGVLHGAAGLIGWSGYYTFNPQHTTLKNMTLTGAINFYGSGTGVWGLTVAENVVNRSDIYDRVLGQPEFEEVYITHPFTNYGNFHKAQNGLTLAISATNFTNYGEWNNYTTVFMGLADQTISLQSDSILRGIVHFDAMTNGNAYQWMKNNTDIPGATQAKLVFNNLTAANAGVYKCRITTNTGTIYSRLITVSTPVGIDDPAPMPNTMVLEQNYPNPFSTGALSGNPVTTVRFTLPEAGDITLKVFDLQGREVMTVYDGYMPAGSHDARINAEQLASGVYFYCLQAGGHALARPMVVLK